MTDYHAERTRAFPFVDPVDLDEIAERAEKDETFAAELRSSLGGPLARLVMAVWGSKLSKLGEIRYAHMNHGVRVNESLHGADLTNEAGGSTEHKASMLKRFGGHVSFNFRVPPLRAPDLRPETLIEAEKNRRDKLVNSMRDKTRNGGLVLEVLGARPNKYLLSSAFVVGYFERVTLKDKTTNVNLGGPSCSGCGTIRRVNEFCKFDARLAKGEVDESDWGKLMKGGWSSTCLPGECLCLTA